MGFWLDIYVATKNRSFACIENFLTAFANLQEDNLREDFEIWLHHTKEILSIGTLQKSIEFGINNPDSSFTLYLIAREDNIKSVIIHFGRKRLLILGLSIENGTESDNNIVEAESLFVHLKDIVNTRSGIIAFETPPSELEEELEKLLN